MMYSRTEVIAALTTTGLLEDPAFKIFMSRIATINVHTIYSEEARDIITEIVYNPDLFDNIISGMIKFYNELLHNNTDDKHYPMSSVCSVIYSSPLLKETADVCFRAAIIDEYVPLHKGTQTENILFELIVLLNIYR